MNAIFTGRKRSGKTTKAFDLAMSLDGGVIIADPKREFRGWPGTVTDVSEIEAQIKAQHEVIIFHPQGDMREEMGKLFRYVLAMHKLAMEKGWDKSGYHFTLIVDEAVNVSTAKWIDEDLLSLVAQNRPEILSVFLTFQSPKDANNLLKSRADNWYIFNTSLPSDLEYLNKEVGVPEDDLALIQDLRPHEYAHFFFDGGAPAVDYEYAPETWFRPLEYSELNAQERGEVKAMARDKDKRGMLRDLIEDLEDLYDDLFEGDERESRRDEPRRRDRGRERDREYRLSGYGSRRERD